MPRLQDEALLDMPSIGSRIWGRPLKCLYFKAKRDRNIELNHRLIIYIQKAHKQPYSQKELEYREKCIEQKTVFRQIKYNIKYKRFCHFGKDKVLMVFFFFTIAFNIKDVC